MELNEYISQVKENNNWISESRIVGESCEEYIKNNIKCIRCNNRMRKDIEMLSKIPNKSKKC